MGLTRSNSQTMQQVLSFALLRFAYYAGCLLSELPSSMP
jgi:hypothetical protein